MEYNTNILSDVFVQATSSSSIVFDGKNFFVKHHSIRKGASVTALQKGNLFHSAANDTDADSIKRNISALGISKFSFGSYKSQQVVNSPHCNKSLIEIASRIKDILCFGIEPSCRLFVDFVSDYYVETYNNEESRISNLNYINVIFKYRISLKSTYNSIRYCIPSFDIDKVDKLTMEQARRVCFLRSSPQTASRPNIEGYPVVIGPGSGATIFHESIGHPLEYNLSMGVSESTKMSMGKIIGPNTLSINDCDIEKGFCVHEEKVPIAKISQRTLVKNGRLKSYLTDRYSSAKFNLPYTASGRRSSYLHPSSPRMGSTFVATGEFSKSEIIGTVEFGVYIGDVSNGEYNPISGDYSAIGYNSYLIEKGVVTKRICNLRISGKLFDITSNIGMIGNDLKWKFGMCHGISGTILTSVGQPTIKYDSLKVEYV
ncbi:hypothetical protein F9L16_22900 [Agarivorans sp. B2Z047]|uniref:TldD/PmbA family protein n=1 Tax=Agarivorans sp. B2Z047 TaxID=2652721 RepID=UPI00128C6B18|nr:metallopeptidase TldD-related protein [Agarivorans sp. B2Z047]MPW31821.1 hypothetical protein [Agarivorans sp. B2Z047]UQN41941.1 TldD/PmbA family protein [Agarivorans sp. B2Z047]